MSNKIGPDFIEFTFDMPPSVNKLYVQRRGSGGRGSIALSEEAKKYREVVKTIVSKNVLALNNFVKRDCLYGIDVTFYFQELVNSGWYEFYSRGNKTGQRKAEKRFKRIDVDNRLKFIQDSFTSCIGLEDDSRIFEVGMRKKVVKKGEASRAVIRLFYLENEKDYLDGEGTKDETGKDAKANPAADQSGGAESDGAGHTGEEKRIIRVSGHATRSNRRRS